MMNRDAQMYWWQQQKTKKTKYNAEPCPSCGKTHAKWKEKGVFRRRVVFFCKKCKTKWQTDAYA